MNAHFVFKLAILILVSILGLTLCNYGQKTFRTSDVTFFLPEYLLPIFNMVWESIIGYGFGETTLCEGIMIGKKIQMFKC